MADRIVLISDDTDFFDYIRLKLELRKSDELFLYSFNEIPEKIHLLENSLLIINSENACDKTIELIKIFKDAPSIIISYNDDENFKKKCYRAGAFDFMPLLTSDSEFRARILPALSVVALLKKNRLYRDILAKNNVISKNNEVFIDYTNIIDKELENIRNSSARAVFGAIAPDDKTKLLLNPNIIETIILNNIRKNDILMNYAPNKYFLILFNSDLKSAEKLWQKIKAQFSYKIYAGFTSITNQSREKLINEALNKLHTAAAFERDTANSNLNATNSVLINKNGSSYSNFKLYRQEFGRKIEKILTPVFYQMQQKYSGKLMGVSIEQNAGEGFGTFYVKGKHFASSFKVTSPGFAKINIDLTLQRDNEDINTKRITLEPEELEAGLLSDLLEQFISEVKNIE